MNQRNSTIELSSSFQPEFRQRRVAGKDFKKIRYKQNCFLIRAIQVVKKYMHENLKHTVKNIWRFGQKNKKNIHIFRQLLPTIANTFSHFMSNNTDTFIELLPNNTTHFSRYQTILTHSESYW